MLIVLTRDRDIQQWCENPKSGAPQWGALKVVSATTNPTATAQIRHFLKEVGSREPLAITGHGNDEEVGDAGNGSSDWVWTVDEVANLLAGLPLDYTGPILMEVCADSVTSFAPRLAKRLGELGRLRGVWIYGYNRAVDVRHTFPAPGSLSRSVELQGTRVG